MHRVAIATCDQVPDLDEDGPTLLQALADRDIVAVPAVWDDASVAWASFDAVLLRSTWDYPAKWREFLGWIDRLSLSTQLINAPRVVHWNVDKRYLLELSRRGVSIVPTWWLENAGQPIPEAAWSGAGQLVVKPVVSAGSKDTRRFSRDMADDAELLVSAIASTGRAVMVQPYVDSVDERGETALLYFGGTFSHAIRKGPLLGVGDGIERGLFRREEIEPRDAEEDELRLGDRVLEALPFERAELAYARVDVVRGPGREPRVIEVELIEPSLFLQRGVGAAARFAAVIAERVRKKGVVHVG